MLQSESSASTMISGAPAVKVSLPAVEFTSRVDIEKTTNELKDFIRDLQVENLPTCGLSKFEALLKIVEKHVLSRDLDLWLEFLDPSGSKEPPSRYLLPAELDHPLEEYTKELLAVIQLLKCTVADQNADLHSINLYDCFGVAYPMSEHCSISDRMLFKALEYPRDNFATKLFEHRKGGTLNTFL
ncbi:hypothetical protein EW026_g1726 [Hermanssonia centrifuga]|uniref:Uncharacterized protein n=1 Tax=Hermanssonia centrifuga TaxID=98765 RepID=A0A4S4KV09_9APHY|nr:hypothetical protein EW026_g1726 [Hermanssonia centrifuga]